MPVAVSSEDAWDFFISFATPDQARAEELCERLDQQGWRVFLADRSIAPGDDWQKQLAAALGGARVAVILLSEHSEAAHYQREEVLLAIDLAKASGLKLVPIYLDGVPSSPAEWEFGLRGYQRIDFRTAGAGGAAEKLGGLLADPEPASEQDRASRQTVGDVLHGAALRIDRTGQWQPLVEICRSRESALFLLHGPRQQNLDLFVSRIFSYLAAESDNHHRPFVVPLRFEFAKPRSAAAWENNLRAGMAEEEQGGGATAEDLLREAARPHPVFLVLSRLPIGAGDLDEVELEALGSFLSDRLPGLIARASAGRHPIRALLATHYDDAGDTLVARLDDKACAGCERHGIRYRKLPPLRALEWTDIEDFLNDFAKRPPRHVYRQLQAAFERLDRESMQFRDVVELLARELY